MRSFLLLCFFLPALARAAITPEQAEFFEKRIRPVLAQECYECHRTDGKRKGGLALDSRPGWMEGGDSGPVLVAGEVRKSLLLQAIRHEDKDLKMPRNGAKLEEATIRDFEKWVEMGAPDPRDRPPTPLEIAHDTDWKAVLERRKGWWSFQPIAHPAVPPASAWASQPVDRFLAREMERAGLAPAGEAEPRLILRRLAYVLTGLPPSPEELGEFARAARSDLQSAVEAAADRMLASPRFGETWARHWMDWVRYAETHGSEGDPQIPGAWRYRDYLIRALNAEVAFPQLLREHLAGDLLDKPRVNDALGINESALGAAHYRMVLHGFTPVDAYDEQTTFVDNQIDTVTKTFLGLTVACARCHNHKFDAISQTDYYALFGIFGSGRPASIDVNLPERQRAGVAELKAARKPVRAAVAQAWQARAGEIGARLEAWQPAEKERGAWLAEEAGPLAAWLRLKDEPPERWAAKWEHLQERWAAWQKRSAVFEGQAATERWDLRGADFAQWEADGAGVSGGPSAPGEYAVAPEGPQVIAGIYGAGVYSHLLSDRQRGVLASPYFTAQGGKLWLRVRGGGEARARYVVRNYPRSGLIYPKAELTAGADGWVSWDLDYWKGERIHLEITTEADQPVESKGKERSWFGVSEAVYVSESEAAAPPPPAASLVAFGGAAPAGRKELRELYAQAVKQCAEHWQAGAMSELEAEFLDTLLRAGLLPNRVEELPEAASALTAYRASETAVAVPTRAPGLLEGFAYDQPLLERGDHKKPAAPVPRRFLEALDPRPYATGDRGSGRRELAESLLSETNPLTPRVIVNRLWLHTFGQGLVTTPDNFGRLGEPPAQPELLNYLASDFRDHGGSIKGFLRMLVTSRAFRLDAQPSPEAAERDPENRLLTHFPARRLEAEAIRDSLLALTGKLKAEQGGPPSNGADYRRSVYSRVVRNNLDPFLTAFDFPVPSATRGRRDSTNVPAQALALMNNLGVSTWAGDWATRIAHDPALPGEPERLARMYEEAFGRAPEAEEKDAALAFVHGGDPAGPADWRRLAHALFNAKEFIYLR